VTKAVAVPVFKKVNDASIESEKRATSTNVPLSLLDSLAMMVNPPNDTF
jgi:hypothetical protein